MLNAPAMSSALEGALPRPQACASHAFVPPAALPSALVAYVTEDVAAAGGEPGAARGELTPRGFTRVVLPQAGAAAHERSSWREAAAGEAQCHGRAARHPGALLREDVMPALGLTAAALARLIGVAPKTLRAILAERAPLKAALALRLGKLCGNGPELWLGLQARYELARAGEALEKEIAAIPTLAA